MASKKRGKATSGKCSGEWRAGREESLKPAGAVSHRGHRGRNTEGTEKSNPRDTADQEIGVPRIEQKA